MLQELALPDFISIQEFELGPKRAYVIDYTNRYTGNGHRNTFDQFGSGTYRGKKPIAASGVIEITQLPQLTNPRSCCSICTTEQQLPLWRTFTPKSVTALKENQGRGRPFDFLDMAQKEQDDGKLYWIVRGKNIDTDPGYIWTSHGPELAVAVGIARQLVEKEPMILFGFNICQHDVADHSESSYMVSVISDGGDRVIIPKTPQNYQIAGLSNGNIVTHITSDQIKQGVVYKIKSSFFARLEAEIDRARELYDTDQLTTSKVSIIVGTLLNQLTQLDSEILQDYNYIPYLPRTWGAFLEQIPNEVLDWTI